jgi:hypothetical protein
MILPPLVFPGYRVSGPIRNASFSSQHNKLERYITLRLNILPGANTLAYWPAHTLRRKWGICEYGTRILDLTAYVHIVKKTGYKKRSSLFLAECQKAAKKVLNRWLLHAKAIRSILEKFCRKKVDRTLICQKIVFKTFQKNNLKLSFLSKKGTRERGWKSHNLHMIHFQSEQI